MKTVIRNLLSLMRRFKMATLLNILGLSVAFTAFIILMMQVLYDWGYDRFHEKADHIFRLEIAFENGNAQAVLPRPLIDEFITSSPHIKNGALLYDLPWDTRRNVVVESGGERTGYREDCLSVYPAFPEVFSFNMLEGDLHVLNEPGKVLIPASMAGKLFPDSSAVGRFFIGGELQAEIGGVYRDFPENSVVKNLIYRKIGDKEGADNWQQHNFQAYILVDNPDHIPQILSNYKANHMNDLSYWEEKDLRLTNLPDIYYLTDLEFDADTTKGNKAQILILFCIAILIIVIAAINFINFNNALVPVRLKSINTQKVLGCSVRALRASMLYEAVFICFLSFCFSIVFIYFLSATSFADIVNGGINMLTNLPLITGTGIFALFTGMVAGCWPAWYITSFQPAVVLKGNFGLSPKGRGLRNILVGTQFAASFVLIIGAVFINLQNNFMTHSSLGFDRDQVAIIKLNNKLGSNSELLRSELNALPEIEETATADHVIGGGDTYSNYGRKYKGEDIFYNLIHADPSVLDVLGVTVMEGRPFFTEDIMGDGVLIFNETARKQYGLEPGSVIELDWGDFHLREKVVGIMEDIKYNSYRNELQPFALYAKKGLRNYAFIRIHSGTNYYALVESVRQVLKKLDPDYPLEISLYNEVLNNVYNKELVLGKQITLFSLIAVFISLVGVFGVVLFGSEYKKREIGIRKVFGSTIREILVLLNNQYVRILTICFVLAVPIAWYMISNWLKNFTYKTPMYWWIFALAFIVVTLVTLLTVTIQNWRAANANPVESIKTE